MSDPHYAKSVSDPHFGEDRIAAVRRFNRFYTRQIGVLKSLGASKAWIASQIEKEALLISLLGVIAGFLLSVAGKYIVQQVSPIRVELEVIWLLYALALGLLSGGLGALYPALRAANQDPVKALSYE